MSVHEILKEYVAQRDRDTELLYTAMNRLGEVTEVYRQQHIATEANCQCDACLLYVTVLHELISIAEQIGAQPS